MAGSFMDLLRMSLTSQLWQRSGHFKTSEQPHYFLNECRSLPSRDDIEIVL